MAGFLGADFDSSVPPDGEVISQGPTRIRDIKARLKTFFAVLFDLETGLFQPGAISSASLASLSPSVATNNAPALAIPAGATSYTRVQVNSKGQVTAGDNPTVVSQIADGSIPISKLATIPSGTAKFINANTAAWSNRTPSNLTSTFTFNGVCSSYDAPAGATIPNNLFVAVGSGGLIATSVDGVTWTQRTSGVSVDLKAVAFGNGFFVAVGLQTANNLTILYSADGITWNQVSAVNINGNVAINQPLYGVAYGTTDGTNYAFVAVGGNGTIIYVLGATFPSPGSGAWLNRSAAIGTDSFFAVAAGGTGTGNDIRAFVAVGGGAAKQVYRSNAAGLGSAFVSSSGGADAVTFNAVHYCAFGPSWAIVGQSGKVDSCDAVAVGIANATPWTVQAGAMGTSNIQCITSGNGVAIAAGAVSASITQAMLSRGAMASWISQSANTVVGQQINAICFGGGVFVAVGANNTIATVGLVPLPNEKSTLKWQHFLSKVPELHEVTFVCLSTDGGWAANDEIDLNATCHDPSVATTANNGPNTVMKNSTVVQMQVYNFGDTNYLPHAFQKDSIAGTLFTMNRDKWALKVTAISYA